MPNRDDPSQVTNGADSQAILRDEFLQMLRCPESRQALQLADEPTVTALNAAISAGNVTNAGGDKLEEPVDAALVREDREMVYTIIGRIPRLTKEEGVPTGQFLG